MQRQNLSINNREGYAYIALALEEELGSSLKLDPEDVRALRVIGRRGNGGAP